MATIPRVTIAEHQATHQLAFGQVEDLLKLQKAAQKISSILDLDRLLELLEGLGPKVAIVRDRFHLQDTPIGSEANLPQLGQIVQPPTDTKV